MMLVNLGSRARDWRSLSPDEQRAVPAAYRALDQTPGVTPGPLLQSPDQATTVRVRDGETVVADGPIGEIEQAVDGYWLVEAESLEHAIELAAGIPAARMGGAIEIRPFARW